MTTPTVGRRLRAIAARVCSADAMDRVIDPLIADLQVEHGEALQLGRRWRARWIRVSAAIAFLKVLAYCGNARMMMPATEGGLIGRTIAYSGIAAALWVGVFMVTVWLNLPSLSARKWLVIAPLSIPQAIPLAIPFGFALGVVVALGGRALSRRSLRLVLLLALVGTVASFATMAWGVAAANTIFQKAVFERPVRGVNELTLFEIRERAWPSANAPVQRPPLFGRHDHRYVERAYYARWAISCATLVFGLLGLAVLPRGRVVRVGVTVVGAITYASCYVFMTSPRVEEVPLPAIAVAWLPNLLMIAAAGALFLVRSRRAM